MRKTRFKPQCLRDLKKIKRHGWNEAKLREIIHMLAQDGRLPSRFQPHKLSGAYAGLWECHIAHDWLLVYECTEAEVAIYRTGTHEDLFG